MHIHHTEDHYLPFSGIPLTHNFTWKNRHQITYKKLYTHLRANLSSIVTAIHAQTTLDSSTKHIQYTDSQTNTKTHHEHERKIVEEGIEERSREKVESDRNREKKEESREIERKIGRNKEIGGEISELEEKNK